MTLAIKSLDLFELICDYPYIICNIYVFILRYQHWNKKNKRERPLTDHSLSNIMYEKKISCSQDEVYVQ